ncbi:MAG: hypothetical protein PHG27_10755 [Massilibacteroides sp.]|nr:hypothetical protein [Massilibacteroides sp.]MDD4116052.1 hypothetical protein [Massilibacteroides sp.]MDD4661241.1 hypothetical protein [Massilibacteroides sp.]
MTQEEVASMVYYCKENGVSYKARIAELGISEWRFYSSKARCAKAQSGESTGEFIQLNAGGPLVPMPSFAPRNTRACSKEKKDQHPAKEISVELRTPTGTLIHIRGEMNESFLQTIIQASSRHV